MKTIQYILFLLGLIISISAFASTMHVTTGHGYYTYNDQVIAYYNLPVGDYALNNNVSYTETSGAPTNQINSEVVNEIYSNSEKLNQI